MTRLSDHHQPIAREGWMAHHPASGKLTHVVNKDWFDEVRAERDRLLERLEGMQEVADYVYREYVERLSEQIETIRQIILRSWDDHMWNFEHMAEEDEEYLLTWAGHPSAPK